ncbi:MAG: hypothetical protein GEU90_01275 [Gemmatimonas sp.]|nr:hypothetical protein [Gemmatimonas sp.]
MPILSLAAVARAPVQLRQELPAHVFQWDASGLDLRSPVRIDLEAGMVGEGVLVRGQIEADFAGECRRCLAEVRVRVRDTVDLLFEPLRGEEELELSGEVYPLPERGDRLDLVPPLRDELMLRIPDFVVCSESCRGLCPQCGAEWNRTTCECVLEAEASPWDALKDIEFD